MFTPEDIASMERAVIAAVAPDAVGEIPGWLLPFDAGPVSRAKSAVPLVHRASSPSVIPQVEGCYAEKGLVAAFRLPDSEGFVEFQAALASRGYARAQPTEMQAAEISRVATLVASPSARISGRPDEEWASVFLGPGFDPAEGARRVERLGRAEGSVYATLHEEGVPVAAGVGAFGFGWASFHGMRTAAAHRGRGFAADVLCALARHAAAKGHTRCMLQVEAGNVPALAVYRRAGFQRAWTYAYWRR